MIHVGKKKHMGYLNKSESKKMINMKYPLDRNGRIFCALKETVLKVYSPKVSGTKNEGTETYKAVWGWGFPYISHTYRLHKGKYLHLRYLNFLPM